ncbi:MAG: hypothetical protein KC422_09675 [Trueperaceae bacterium]|nr:hypothetical protein [Trueperaceae bacterium]
MARNSRTNEAVETYALFRPESALTIALTLVLTSLSMMGAGWIPGKWWMWLLGGIVAETLLIINTVRDRSTVESIEEDLFLDQLQPERLRNPALKAKVNRALEYHLLILKEIDERDLKLGPELFAIIERMDNWILMIYKLAQNLDNYQNDPILKRDLARVPEDLKNLRQKLRYEDGKVRLELEKTIASKEKQLQSLENVQDSLERAELQIDNTLSAMGTVYSQIMHLSTQSGSSEEAGQLQNDIFEQIEVLETMNLEMDKIPVG